MTDDSGHPGTAPRELPPIPRAWTAPLPVIAVGLGIWIIAAIVTYLTKFRWPNAFTICLVGVVVGVLGTGMYLFQLSGAKRGARTAQKGLV